MGSEKSTGGLTYEKFGSLGKYYIALVGDLARTNLDIRLQPTRSVWRTAHIPPDNAICVNSGPCCYLGSACSACHHSTTRKQKPSRALSFLNPLRTYAVEPSKHCSSAIYRRWTPFPTPDESGNYSKGSIRKCVTLIHFDMLGRFLSE